MHRSDSEVAEEVAGVYLLNFFFCFGSKEKEKEKMLIKKKKMAVSGRQRKEEEKEQLPNSVTDDICSFFPLRREVEGYPSKECSSSFPSFHSGNDDKE